MRRVDRLRLELGITKTEEQPQTSAPQTAVLDRPEPEQPPVDTTEERPLPHPLTTPPSADTTERLTLDRPTGGAPLPVEVWGALMRLENIVTTRGGSLTSAEAIWYRRVLGEHGLEPLGMLRTWVVTGAFDDAPNAALLREYVEVAEAWIRDRSRGTE